MKASTRHSPFYHSIRFKMIIAFAMLHTLLLVIFSFDQVHKQKDFLVEQSSALTIGVAEALASSSIPWVLSNDLAGLEEIVSAQTELPDVQFAMITDTQGKVLAYQHKLYQTSEIGNFIQLPNFEANSPYIVHFDDDNVIDISVPILIESSMIGWARIQMSRAPIPLLIDHIIIESILFTIAASLLGGLVAWLLGKHLTAPIYRLLSATRSVRQGVRKIDIENTSVNEFDSLNENFRVMVNELREKERALSQEKEFAETTLKAIGDGVVVTDARGIISYINPAGERILGRQQQNILNRPVDDALPVSDTKNHPITHPVEQVLHNNTLQLSNNAVVMAKISSTNIMLETICSQLRDHHKIVGAVMVFRDVSEAFRLQQKLLWQANHDSLTQLHNRQAFETELDRAINECTKHENYLLYIDLDQFKIVNDTVGHHAGDQLLKRIGSVLEKQLPKNAFLARIGGDEFAVVIENCDLNTAKAVANMIRTGIAKTRFYYSNKVFDIGCSIGVATIRPGTNRETVLSQADIACYLAKERGRNRIEVYQAMDNGISENQQIMDWVNNIKEGIENERFVLFGQSLEPLQDNGETGHFEVLVRFMDPQGNIIPPTQFLNAAERFGLMHQLDLYVINKAIQALQTCHSQISLMNVNISGQSLSHPDFNDALINILKTNKGLNEKICFEITETVAISQMHDTIEFLNHIKNFGCKLALDDFGSGFSSFSWLKNLPVDYVKIDGSFVLDLIDDPIDAAMVEAIQNLSERMNILSVAEFVENKEIADWLQAHGVDYAQGYYFCKPKPLRELLSNCPSL